MSDELIPQPRMDVDRLEQLARAATPGYWDTEQEWEGSPPHEYRRIWSQYPGPFRLVAQRMEPPDAEFIAAARPAVVLELIRRLRAAEDGA